MKCERIVNKSEYLCRLTRLPLSINLPSPDGRASSKHGASALGWMCFLCRAGGTEENGGLPVGSVSDTHDVNPIEPLFYMG